MVKFLKKFKSHGMKNAWTLNAHYQIYQFALIVYSVEVHLMLTFLN